MYEVLKKQGRIAEPFSSAKQESLRKKYAKDKKYKQFQIGSYVMKQMGDSIVEKGYALKRWVIVFSQREYMLGNCLSLIKISEWQVFFICTFNGI